MKIKVSVVLLTFMLLMSLLPMNAFASSTNEANSALSSYLLATQKGDINQMVALSNDSRVSPDASIVEFYSEMLNKQSEQLVAYKILAQEVLSPTSYKFITVLTFKNGDSSQVPFTLSYDKGYWRVILTPNSLEDSKYKVIKGENLISGISTTTPTTPVTISPELVSPSLTSLCSWSFTGLTTTMYSINTFNVNSVYSQVLVQGGQAPSVGYYFTPNISYAVVQPHWYGDTVWGYTWHSGTGTYSFLINGQSLTFSNAKMRFSMSYTGNKADGSGNVYNN
ncbi:MAG: hypothetical protein WA125_10890 [Desulfosporosinus sp.]